MPAYTMTNYCDQCFRVRPHIRIQECEYCGDYFCATCDPRLGDIFCCKHHQELLTFCSRFCVRQYRNTPWRCFILNDVNFDPATMDGEEWMATDNITPSRWTFTYDLDIALWLKLIGIKCATAATAFIWVRGKICESTAYVSMCFKLVTAIVVVVIIIILFAAIILWTSCEKWIFQE